MLIVTPNPDKGESMLWAAVVRDETLLVQSLSMNEVPDVVLKTARGLLDNELSVEWRLFSCSPLNAYRGLKLHVFQEVNEEKDKDPITLVSGHLLAFITRLLQANDRTSPFSKRLL